MVRSPCCEKGGGLKKGPWTPEEDQKLLAYIEEHGLGSWQALPAKAGLKRCGKSCRLRWTNYLRPDIKRGKFSLQEEQTIIQLHALLGNKWSAIATHLPKRTDNEIKNYWNTHLKKRLDRMGIDPVTHKPKADAFGYGRGHSKDVANLSHMAQWESARLEAEARLVRESKLASKPLPNLFGFSASFLPPQLTTTTATVDDSAAKSTPQSRPKCLDVLKAWQRMVSGMFFGPTDTLESPTSTLNFSDHTLPIPTMASVHENPILMLQFGNATKVETCKVGLDEEIDHKIPGTDDDWKCVFEKPKQLAQVKEAMDGSVMAMHEMGGAYDHLGGEIVEVDNAWILDSFRAENGNEITMGSTGDGELSDMLVYNNSSSSNMAGVGDDAAENCFGNGNTNSNNNNDNIEEQGNYWNSLLNLVDAPPSASPPLF